MKHLRKYNENIDIETIKDILLEVSDHDNVKLEIQERTHKIGSNNRPVITSYEFIISVKIPDVTIGSFYGNREVDFESMFQQANTFKQTLNEITPVVLECMQRIKDVGYRIIFSSFGTTDIHDEEQVMFHFGVSNIFTRKSPLIHPRKLT